MRFCGIMMRPPMRNARMARIGVPAAPATAPTEVKIPDPMVVPTPRAITVLRPRVACHSFAAFDGLDFVRHTLLPSILIRLLF